MVDIMLPGCPRPGHGPGDRAGQLRPGQLQLPRHQLLSTQKCSQACPQVSSLHQVDINVSLYIFVAEMISTWTSLSCELRGRLTARTRCWGAGRSCHTPSPRPPARRRGGPTTSPRPSTWPPAATTPRHRKGGAGSLASNCRASNEGYPKISQSQRRPLLGPSPGWKHQLALPHLRHYSIKTLC